MAAQLALVAMQATSQIIGGFLQADQVRRQAETQARIAEFNAQLAEYDAWKTEAYGATLVARMQNDTDQARGATKVYAASRGIKVEGSLAEVSAQNELNSFLNKIDVDNRTTEQAMGYKRQASQIRLGSSLNTQAANLQANSLIVGSIAQGAGTVAASVVRNQKVTEDDLNLPKETASGYSSFKSSNDLKPYKTLGLSLMPGGS
jgi:hypothetical protein